MEFLRKLLVQTQSYLKGLSVSQGLAIGSCVALILVALLWLVDWAGKPALVPLLDQTLSAQELTPIQQRLDAAGAQYKVVGNTVMVASENRARLLAQLGQSRALPSDISLGFTKIIEESNPFLSMEQQGRLWSLARSNELSRFLCSFDGVDTARVFIDEKSSRTLGHSPVTSTASVIVKLKPGFQLDRDRVFAMASFVSSAVAGLDISNVSVTDATTTRSFKVPTPADGMATDDLEDRAKKEAYFGNQIKELLANIPGLLVVVHAELDPESRKETKQIHGKPVTLVEKSETTTQKRGSSATGPGTVPNTARANAAAGPMEESEKSVTESTSDGKVDVTLTTTEAPRHGVKTLSASVNVPWSYMAKIYKQANNNKEPTDADLEKMSEVTKIKRQVESALGNPKGSDLVDVAVFHDDALVKMSDVMQAGSDEGMLAMARMYGGKFGIGALAVVSLFMMLMMVRRASEGPVLPGEEAPVAGMRIKGRRRNDTSSITIGAVAVGEASESEQLMVAKEVDESTIRTQQVVEQVVDLIRDDPDTSVSILQRWIDAEKS